MADYETKLKLGRKLEGVDAAKASDNQASFLFRYGADGVDKHVSVTIESDAMTGDDVEALLRFLDQRGILRNLETKTWVSQPQASVAKFGDTTTWAGMDVKAMTKRVQMMP